MIDDTFRDLCSARPFWPFDIELATGQMIAVSHPELIYNTDRQREFGIGRPDGTVEIVRLAAVKRITPRPRGRRPGERGPQGK